jgi:hypothetical protein
MFAAGRLARRGLSSTAAGAAVRSLEPSVLELEAAGFDLREVEDVAD